MTADDRARFAKNIRLARKHLDLSQAELAARFGVERHSVSRWEKAGTLPPDRVKAQVVKRLGDVPPAIVREIAAALGAAPSPAVAPSVDHRATVDMIVYRVADQLDMTARSVRATLLRALTEMDRSGVPITEALPALAARK
jgi:DNA-binding XRE family transcriptional regulator